MFSSFSYFSLAIRIFCFFAHFILLVFLLLIWIWAKKGWRRFPSLLLLIFFLIFFVHFVFIHFIYYGEISFAFLERPTAAGPFVESLITRTKPYISLTFSFELLKHILWTLLIYWFWCASKVCFFFVFFGFFRFLLGNSVIFACQKIRTGYIWFSWYFWSFCQINRRKLEGTQIFIF